MVFCLRKVSEEEKGVLRPVLIGGGSRLSVGKVAPVDEEGKFSLSQCESKPKTTGSHLQVNDQHLVPVEKPQSNIDDGIFATGPWSLSDDIFVGPFGGGLYVAGVAR